MNKQLTKTESLRKRAEAASHQIAADAANTLRCTDVRVAAKTTGVVTEAQTTSSAYFVLRCLTGHEERACELLSRQGISALCLRTRTFERISRKRIIATDAALFPGYLFAQIGASQWPKLREMPFVSRHPLMSDGRPHQLSAADLAYLQVLALNPPRDPREMRRVGVGDRVAIVSGPLKGITGTVAALVGRHVQMLADVIGRMTVSPDQLELATANA